MTLQDIIHCFLITIRILKTHSFIIQLQSIIVYDNKK